MASPAASATEEDNVGAVQFNFCINCSNLLHPFEDKQTRTLKYRCRTCYFTKDAESACISRRMYTQNQGATAGVTQDVAEDPALQRANTECPKCHETEAVFFQSQQRHKDTGMELFYVCTSCGNLYTLHDNDANQEPSG